MSKIVYLAGPITSLSYSGATDWRENAELTLRSYGLDVRSPMRGCRYLSGEVSIPAEQVQHTGIMATSRGILTRDKNDCITADALLVYFPSNCPPSIGTSMEIAFAHLRHIPIVGVSEDRDNIHRRHPMLSEAVTWADNLSEACQFIVSILGGN